MTIETNVLFDGNDNLFKKILSKTKVYGEYGCGLSTNWVLKNTQADILSVDTSKVWIESVKSTNIKYKNRLIFDGYPRNKAQAENLNRLLKKYDQKINLVLKLSVSLDVIKKRITGRSVCSICGKIYNEFFNPPPINAECCASKFLQKRSDDTLDIAITRYETYEKNIKPVIDFYEHSKLLKVVNGETPISEITKEIGGLIKCIKG